MAKTTDRIERGIFRRKEPRTGRVAAPLWVSWTHHGQSVTQPVPPTLLPTGELRLATVPEARKYRALKIAAAATGAPHTARALRVATLLDGLEAAYRADARPSLRTVLGHLRVLRADLGHLRASEVTATRIRAWQQQKQAAGMGAVTLKRYSETLRRAYRLALADDRIGHMPQIPMPVAHSPRGKYIKPADAIALREALPDYAAVFFEAAHLSGVRRRQLSVTERAWVDLARGVVTYPLGVVKAREPHVMPLDEHLRELFARQLALGAARPWCPYVFHGRTCAAGRRPSATHGCIGEWRKALVTAAKQAGIVLGRKADGYVFHHTRNTAVTDLRAAGATVEDIMAQTGHRTTYMVRHYDLGDVQAVARRISEARRRRAD